MNYEDWIRSIPKEIAEDTLWKMEAYRLALFVGDVGWFDVTKLMQDRRTLGLSDQLYRACGSISANIAEGYSRSSNKDRARFYEYALGSARESRDWYHKSQNILGAPVISHRVRLLTQIIRLLLTMVPEQRGHTIHEAAMAYETNPVDLAPPDRDVLDNLLQAIPF
jgi:four helix bundle protein